MTTATEMLAEPAPDLIPAEQAALGVAIGSRKGAEAVGDIVRPHHFFRPAHGVILETALRLAEAGREVDPVVILGELTRAGELARTGGGPYLHTLMAARLPGWQAHARRVLDDWRRRNLATAAMSVLDEATSPGFDPETAFDRARKLIEDATAPPGTTELRTMSELVTDVVISLEREDDRGLTLPWRDLTHVLAGLAPGELIIVAARPSIGKSIMGAQIAAHAGMSLGVPALLASMEMTAEEITLRLIAAEARVSLSSLERRVISHQEWDRIAKGSAAVADSVLVIDDTADVSLAHLRSRLRGMARTGTPGLLVVDYLGLLAQPPGAENRQNAVAVLSRGLKLIAREFSIPVVVLAQLNRNSEHRPDHRPMLSDLRDSGAIEADADIVLLLHREDAYDSESARAGEIDVIVAKNRQGPQCTVTEAFQGHYGRITDMARPDQWSPTSVLEDK